MKILSIGGSLQNQSSYIESIEFDMLNKIDIKKYSYIIIHGGDGAIRRMVAALNNEFLPPIIINPTGSFNVIAKYYHIKNPNKIIDNILNGNLPKISNHKTYSLNGNLFLFSAGNMSDAQHIAISESLRFGWLKNGSMKYILAFIFLLPLHIILLPWFIWSKKHFFIFTLFKKIGNYRNIYTSLTKINLTLPSNHNIMQIDGDILIVSENHAIVKEEKEIRIVTDA